MQNPSKKCSDHASYSKPDEMTSQLWWISSADQTSQSSVSHNLMDLNSSGHFPTEAAQFGYTFKNPDLSSAHTNGFGISEGKTVDDHVKSVLLSGGYELVHSIPKTDYPQSLASLCPYSNNCLGGVFSAYGSNSMPPQMVNIASSGRALVPLELREDGPIYVNAKQYHGIIRRRQLRAKLEAENKLVKSRKPYLHESRHLHAMKRLRGAGGRFLNTKELQLQQQQHQAGPYQQIKSTPSSSDARSTLPLLELGTGVTPHSNASSSTFSGSSSGSEVTDVSNHNDMFQLPDHLHFAEFHSHVGGMQNGFGMMFNG